MHYVCAILLLMYVGLSYSGGTSLPDFPCKYRDGTLSVITRRNSSVVFKDLCMKLICDQFAQLTIETCPTLTCEKSKDNVLIPSTDIFRYADNFPECCPQRICRYQ
ncbi:PREDICTED: uncharacterized protein LOC108770956 [Trachymyrmex cornetzi]|uniref:uncharacterized protein LOC108770956 n=1 Tax=Trachymyrmex cornetzi TaxID=471704 RepID=UPI00084F76D2|nr:PREDICTED: uncharacterized protein LOC108770956 [Trachymyrmex cornetzi]